MFACLRIYSFVHTERTRGDGLKASKSACFQPIKNSCIHSCMMKFCIIPAFRREVLKTWKRKLGSGATYNDLIKAFQQAGYEGYAEVVKGLLMNDMRTNTGSSNRDTTPPLPSTEQPSPVFPPESELFSESPKYAAAPVVKLQKHDYELGTKELLYLP